MRIVSLFDHSGNMVRPWAEAGHECYCYDIKYMDGPEMTDGPLTVKWEKFKTGGSITRIYWDAFDKNQPDFGEYDILFAFPPCDHLAVSGARWFKGKGLKALASAIALVAIAAELADKAALFSMIENPISTLSTYWRKPDYIFQPYEYGDPYYKKTCLWVSENFKMPEPNPVEPVEGAKIHMMPGDSKQKERRSITPEGFARAVFEANK